MDKISRQLVNELDFMDIPEPLQKMAEKIGLEKFAEVVYNFGGLTIYFPKFENLTAPARNRLIVQEFDGGNYDKLAMKYRVTEVWVRQIVNSDLLKKNQIKLF